MFRLTHWIGATLLLASSATFAASSADTPPDVLVKNTADEVLAIIRQDKDLQAGNQRKVVELAEQKVLPHFDFTRMTQLTVGKYWRQATPEQQQALIKQFRTLLVRTYSSSLKAYRNQTIETKPLRMNAGDTDVTVKSQVNQPGGQPIPIDYAMEKTPEGWKVYDIIVDGVSLVTNYRTSFVNEIRQNGVDGLVKRLAARNAELSQEAKTSTRAPATSDAQ